jgi:YfiH family protein
MKEYKKKQLSWLEFDIFQPYCNRIRHGCFTRKGGTSQVPYSSLNVGSNVGDNPSHVEANRALIANCFDSELKYLFDVEQVHKTNSVLIQKEPTSFIQADILLNSTKNNILMIKHADCQAALFYDPEHHTCAVVHAGWRGLVQQAYTKAISEMTRLWKTNPKNLLVGISPSLSLSHSEFLSWQKDFPQEMWSWATPENKIDLLGISKQELTQAGVLFHNIECAQICTFETSDLFFSYRREKITGRNATCIQLI